MEKLDFVYIYTSYIKAQTHDLKSNQVPLFRHLVYVLAFSLALII